MSELRIGWRGHKVRLDAPEVEESTEALAESMRYGATHPPTTPSAREQERALEEQFELRRRLGNT